MFSVACLCDEACVQILPLTNDECGIECDGYICGKCASKSIPHIIEQQKELDKHIAKLEQEYKDNPPMMPQDLPAAF